MSTKNANSPKHLPGGKLISKASKAELVEYLLTDSGYTAEFLGGETVKDLRDLSVGQRGVDIKKASGAAEAEDIFAKAAPTPPIPKAAPTPEDAPPSLEEIEAADAKADANTKRKGDGLTKMTLEQLLAEYQRVVQRPTGSTNEGYLIWKIRETQKGRYTPGPATRGGAHSGPSKVFTVRIPTAVCDALDAALKEMGYGSRMDFMRTAIISQLNIDGKADVAALFDEPAPEPAEAAAA